MTEDGPAAEPTLGEAAFTRAVRCDRDEDEAAAIPLYREALALGLPDALDLRARLGLARSLREIGEVGEAVAVHAELAARAPQLRANRLFLALARLQAGAPGAALAEAIMVAAELGEEAGAQDIVGDAPALRDYAERLSD